MTHNTNVAQNFADNTGTVGEAKGTETSAALSQIVEAREYDVPYKGLNPYAEIDASIFFGRENDIQKVVNSLLAWRLTVLYGKSGVGKSSILQAGVTHTLNEEARQNIADYDGAPKLAVVVFPSLEGDFSWKDDPLTGLMKQIEATIADNGWNIPFPKPGLSFVDTLENWTDALGGEGKDGELYLILDQFEEYFLYHSEENGEGTFFSEFPRAVNASNLRVNFLISIREDAIADLDRFQSRIPGLFDHRLQIGHLDGRAAKEAIIKPIEYYNQQHGSVIAIEPSLVDAVLNEVQVGKVVLGDIGLGGIDAKPKSPAEMQIETPYLQLVMERLWKEERDQKSSLLRLETFKALGRSDQIVKNHLNRQMQLLTEEERQIAAGIFQHLVTSSGIKYAYSILDLADYTGYDKTLLKYLLEKLSSGKQRILRPVGVARRDQPNTQRYEIFHDALAPAILAWRRHYLEHQKQAEELAEQRSRLSHRVRWAIGGAIISTALLVGSVAIWQIGERQEKVSVGEQRLKINEAVQQAETGSQLQALQNAMLAVQKIRYQHLKQANPNAALGLQQILNNIQEKNQFQALPEGVATTTQSILSSTEELAATISLDGRVSVWTLDGEKLSDFQAFAGMPIKFDFLKDGQRLATAAVDGTVAVWNLDGRRLAGFNLPQDAGWVSGFSSDGQRLVTTNLEGIVRLWTLEGKELSEFNTNQGRIIAVSFSPDGQHLVTVGQDNTVYLWDTQGKRLAEFKGHQGAIFFAKFDDKEQLVTSGQDGTVRVWNLEGEELEKFKAQQGPIYYLEISPNGQRVATASADGIVHLWDRQGNRLAELKGHENIVTGVSFAPDGQQLATITRNGTVRQWTMHSQERTSFLASRGFTFRGNIRFSADGQTLITSAEGIARWDMQGRRLERKPGSILSFVELGDQLRYVIAPITNTSVFIQDFQQDRPPVQFKAPQGSMIWNAELSPNGRWLVTTAFAAGKSIVQVWNVENPQENPREIHLQNEEPVTAIEFSPDGNWLATASWNGRVYLWNPNALQDKPLRGPATRGGFVSALEFSPDSQKLAIAAWDNTASVWNLQGEKPQELQGHQAPVRSIHFSPDGQQLLTSSLDGTARLWDLQGRQWAEYPGHNNSGVVDAAFNPNGQQIAMLSLDGYVEYWPIKHFDQLIEEGCNWLTDYLAIHPEVQQQLTICKPQ